MERVAEALTASRSRLAERVKEPIQGRPPRHSKAENAVRRKISSSSTRRPR